MKRRLWGGRVFFILTLSMSGFSVVQAQSAQTDVLATQLGAAVSPLVTAQSSPNPITPEPDLDERLEGIKRQRQVLAAQRSAIAQAEESQQAACWQKFAVNACLSDARRARRLALEPLRQKELILNAQERTWRTEQRDKRLQDKQTENRGTP